MKTDEELTQLGVDIMGYVDGIQGRAWVIATDDPFFILKQDFSPPTKIEHALECARRLKAGVKFYPSSDDEWLLIIETFDDIAWMEIDVPYLLKTLPDCARKIMLTLYKEVENG